MYRRKPAVKSNKAQKDVLNMTCRSEGLLAPTQGVTVANYIYYTQPIFNSANNSDVTKNQDFLAMAMQYDRWRINSVTVRLIPKATSLDLAQAQDDAKYNVSGNNRIYSVLDRNGNAPPDPAALLRYSSVKTHSVIKSWSRKYTVKYPKDTWLDTKNLNSAAYTFSQGIGLNGTITFYAENILEDSGEWTNEPWAVFQTFYNVTFQGKIGSNVTVNVDENGLPVSITQTPYIYDVDKPVCRLLGIKGTIVDSNYTEDDTKEPVVPA